MACPGTETLTVNFGNCRFVVRKSKIPDRVDVRRLSGASGPCGDAGGFETAVQLPERDPRRRRDYRRGGRRGALQSLHPVRGY